MDAEPAPENRPAPSRAQLSRTPSWIMLGFLLGGAFVVSLWAPWKKPPRPAPGALPPPVVTLEPAEPRQPPRLTTIEDLFATWGEHAVWSDDTTQVAIWQEGSKTPDADLFYEVRRVGDTLYFRSLPRLTRRLIKRGRPVPGMQFTETEEHYREWLEHGRKERK